MTTVLEKAPVARKFAGRRVMRLLEGLYSRPSSAIGTTVTLLFLVLALSAPLLTPYKPTQIISQDARQPPSFTHWFGTDNLGRDVFSRVVYGAYEILSLSGAGTFLALLAGTSIGLFSGYLGGWIDEVIMRLFDSLLALPVLLLALLLLGMIGPSKYTVLIVLVVVYTPIIARVVRSATLSIKSKSYIEAARLQGETGVYILFREILPGVLPVLSVEAALRFSYAIFLVASLGFLGVGVQPPSPNWGVMVKEARAYVEGTPWAMYFPAAAISILVTCVNLLADGLKRVLSGDYYMHPDRES